MTDKSKLVEHKERPASLTPGRCMECQPTMRTSAEWRRKRDAGELPEGILGCCGMLEVVWPEDHKLTAEEAKYILWLSKQGSMRWLASELTGDCAQPIGMFLIEAAELVLAEQEKLDG